MESIISLLAFLAKSDFNVVLFPCNSSISFAIDNAPLTLFNFNALVFQ